MMYPPSSFPGVTANKSIIKPHTSNLGDFKHSAIFPNRIPYSIFISHRSSMSGCWMHNLDVALYGFDSWNGEGDLITAISDASVVIIQYHCQHNCESTYNLSQCGLFSHYINIYIYIYR